MSTKKTKEKKIIEPFKISENGALRIAQSESGLAIELIISKINAIIEVLNKL